MGYRPDQDEYGDDQGRSDGTGNQNPAYEQQPARNAICTESMSTRSNTNI